MVQPLAGWWRQRGWVRSYQVVLRELKQQKSSKPSRDLSQSVCQRRMKSAFAEATQRSRFNAIHFALTEADTKWVIILHCSFLNRACVNCFSTAPKPALYKQRTTKTSEDIKCKECVSETERGTLVNAGFGQRSELNTVYSVCSEGHCSDSLSIFIMSCLVLWYTEQHLRPRARLRVWEASWQHI